jgi:hypothetical protein
MDICGNRQDFPVKVTRTGVLSLAAACGGAGREGRGTDEIRDSNSLRRMFKILRLLSLNDKLLHPALS